MQLHARATALLVLTLALAIVELGPSATAAHSSSFVVRCASSHVLNDDPIVFPGEPGRAHRHEFFGARAAQAWSTTASLAAGGTSCDLRADTAAYWAPTLEVNGTLVRGELQHLHAACACSQATLEQRRHSPARRPRGNAWARDGGSPRRRFLPALVASGSGHGCGFPTAGMAGASTRPIT
jgi:hypothetical protein